MQEELAFRFGLAPSRVRTFCSLVSEISSGAKPASATVIWKRLSSRRSMLWGIGLFSGPLDLAESVENAVEPDGRPPDGSPIITHIQILLGADGYGQAPDTAGARPGLETPKASRRRRKNLEADKRFQGARRDFLSPKGRWLMPGLGSLAVTCGPRASGPDIAVSGAITRILRQPIT